MGKGKRGGSFGVTIDVSPLNKLAEGLKGFEKEIPGAAASAINRTVTQVVNRVGRIVTERYAIKTGEVKESMKGHVSGASKSKLKASVRSVGHTLSFAHFPFSPTTPIIARSLGAGHPRAKVKVRIKKDKGKVQSKKGFVAKTGAQSADKTQYNVFKRIGTFKIARKGRYTGQRREQIAPIRTLSIPQMITHETTAEKITAFANTKLAERVEHEIKWRLEKVKAKVEKG